MTEVQISRRGTSRGPVNSLRSYAPRQYRLRRTLLPSAPSSERRGSVSPSPLPRDSPVAFSAEGSSSSRSRLVCCVFRGRLAQQQEQRARYSTFHARVVGSERAEGSVFRRGRPPPFSVTTDRQNTPISRWVHAASSHWSPVSPRCAFEYSHNAGPNARPAEQCRVGTPRQQLG